MWRKLKNIRCPRTQKNHRNRIKAYYEFLESSYPDYFSVGVRPVTDNMRDIRGIYFHNNRHDLIYTGFNVDFFKAFLATKKRKENNKMCSYSNLVKYKDAIIFGSKEVKELLPPNFYEETTHFLSSFKKEVAKAKERGEVDESESDPIPHPLMSLLCLWCIETGNIFAWCWTLLQWHCMGRAVNIDPLGFRNFTLSEDCFKIKYDTNKADQTGGNVITNIVMPTPLIQKFVCIYLFLSGLH